MTKRIVSVLLLLILAIGMSSCGSSEKPNKKSKKAKKDYYTIQELEAGEIAEFKWGTMKLDNPVPNPGLYSAYQKVPVEISANSGSVWIEEKNFVDVPLKLTDDYESPLFVSEGLFDSYSRELKKGDTFKGYVYFDNNTSMTIKVRFDEYGKEYGADWKFTYDTETVTSVDCETISNQLVNTKVQFEGYCVKPMYERDGTDIDVMLFAEDDMKNCWNHIRLTIPNNDEELYNKLSFGSTDEKNGTLVKVKGRITSFKTHKKEFDYYDWWHMYDSTIEIKE